ncbi:MAG: hypothetical protein IJ680_05830 [Paludibacteraceae bacterium]|nr:hypothetical protein [Paludibacteraceae bacterium]
MHRTRINISLSDFGIRKAVDALKDYDRQLQNKCAMFVDKMAEVGIATAKLNCGDYGNVITFSKQLSVGEHGANGKLIAVGTPVFRRRGGETIEADPLLLAEFGSGWNAKVLDKVDGVGQGTFPGQTHAFDPRGWWYVDEHGESHHSYGESPTFPMHSAAIAMLFDINRVAKEVFGNG